MKKLNSRAKPGDVFYVPAANVDGQVGFNLARYICKVEPNIGYLIEVFAKFHTILPSDIAGADTKERLFRPIMCSFRFADIPPWRILFSDPRYEVSQSDFQSIEFAFDTKLWRGGELIAAKAAAGGVEPATCWRMQHIVFRVMAHLFGALDRDDRFDYQRLPPRFRVDNIEGKALVTKICAEIEAKFSDL